MFDFYSRMREYWSRCEEEQKSKEAVNATLRPQGRWGLEGLQGKKSSKLEDDPGFHQSKEKGWGPFEKVEDTGECILWSSNSRVRGG